MFAGSTVIARSAGQDPPSVGQIRSNKDLCHLLKYFGSNPSNAPPQATALKTSSGKGDLQCSATNAGDWVCISQCFIKLIIDGTDDHHHYHHHHHHHHHHNHHYHHHYHHHHKVIIPGIGRRCRYAWPATAEETAVRPFGLIVHSDNTEVAASIILSLSHITSTPK